MCVLKASQLGEGSGTRLQYSCLENPMGWGAWWAAVHGVTKSRTRLSDSTFTFHFHALEKEMATHSSVLAWRIPGTGEPGGLPSMGSHRVRHDCSDSAAAAAASRKRILSPQVSWFHIVKYGWTQSSKERNESEIPTEDKENWPEATGGLMEAVAWN